MFALSRRDKFEPSTSLNIYDVSPSAKRVGNHEVTKELSRQAPYDLVWSTPVKTLATLFNISDASLRKACQRSQIPLPPAGYWAKLAAGKRVAQPSLPARPPGMSDTVTPGAGRYDSYSYRHWSDAELLVPLPARPTSQRSERP